MSDSVSSAIGLEGASGKRIAADELPAVSSANSVLSARSEHDIRVSENGSSKKLKVKSTTDGPETSRLTINPAYTVPEFIRAVSLLLKVWKEGSAPSSPADVQPALNYVFRKPFPHLIFPDFLRGPIESVEEELLAQKFNSLSTDLLQLSQTKELSHESVFEFHDLTESFHEDVRPWVESITNVPLLPTVDIRGARYTYTDHLVCHDDRLTSRKVAYVYYLTDPSWSAEDGGTLDLFDSICSNDVIIPGAVEKRITPVRNTMVLFLVGDDSFHQVSEVLSTRKARLSLTGWFHSKSNPVPRPEFQEHNETQYHEIIEAKKEEMELCFLARADRFTLTRVNALAKDLEKYQACQVRNVLSDPFYHAVVEELRLKGDGLPWMMPGNRNQAGCYKYINASSQKWAKEMPNFNQLLRIFLTQNFLHSLGTMTGFNITIMPAADAALPFGKPKKDVLVNGSGSSGTGPKNSDETDDWVAELAQFRLERFEHGSYTLKTMDAVQMDEVIDIFYFMDCDNLEPGCGGAVVVVDINESSDDWDPIVSMDGQSNGMVVVRREKDVVFFTEYLNERWARRNGGRPFYRLWMSFSTDEITSLPVVDADKTAVSSGSDVESDESDLMEPDEADAALSSSEEDEEEDDEN